VARLGTGRLRIRLGGGGEKVFLLNGGFAELHDDQLTLVADEIIAKESLVGADARKRLDDAIAAIAAPGTPDLEARERLERERQVASVAVALSEGR
jgi:F0F1-type ATP synthase epsilon subunit